MRDPAAIPLLAGTGHYAALIDFGRQALPDLLRVAREEDFFPSTDALATLRQMVQVRGLEYFTAQERAQLKAVAGLYLSPGSPTNPKMYYAAQLLLVLEDEEARSWVVGRGNQDVRDLLDGAPMEPLVGRSLDEILAKYREAMRPHWENR